jgi:hypothetical protein
MLGQPLVQSTFKGLHNNFMYNIDYFIMGGGGK